MFIKHYAKSSPSGGNLLYIIFFIYILGRIMKTLLASPGPSSHYNLKSQPIGGGRLGCYSIKFKQHLPILNTHNYN